MLVKQPQINHGLATLTKITPPKKQMRSVFYVHEKGQIRVRENQLSEGTRTFMVLFAAFCLFLMPNSTWS